MKLIHLTGALLGLPVLASTLTDVTPANPCVWLASETIGMKVVSQQGENLGKIEDIVVHPGGQSSYAVLSYGGWLGMGDKLFAMPWSVLRTVEADTAKPDSSRSIVLPLDKERLKTAPGFDKSHWPTMADPDWAKDVDAYYWRDTTPGVSKSKPVDASMTASVITWRASELKGANVKTPSGEKLGDIKEIAVDTNGRVNYIALSVGGFLGINDRLVAVPWDSLAFSLSGDKGDKRHITLNTTKEQLERAPRYKEGKEYGMEMCDPKWVEDVYDYFNCPKYWSKDSDIGLGKDPNAKGTTKK